MLLATSKKVKLSATSSTSCQKRAKQETGFLVMPSSPKVKKKVKPVVVKKQKVAERRLVTSHRIEVEGTAGKRAQQGKLTMLERNSISVEQENRYHHYLNNFRAFCVENGSKFPQKCSRRRKDPGSLGVPVSQLERQASPQQTGLEGVEKTSSPKIQASLAQTCGVRDSYETAAARSSRDGTSSPPELRHVPQTGGDVRPLSEKSGEPGSWDGATIQDVHLGDPRPRGRGARQDRSLQQLFESGQSGDSDLAGAHVGEFGEKSDAKRCALQLSGGQVPEGISKGRILSWVAVTSSVPAASRRGVRRLVQRSSRSCRSQRPWQMADRQFSQKICQDREDSKPVAAVARVEPQLLPPVNGQDGSSVEGDHTPPEHLNHDNNWREATGEFCLEIFAGCRRLTRALQKRGLRCYSIDVCLDPHDDVLDPDVEKK